MSNEENNNNNNDNIFNQWADFWRSKGVNVFPKAKDDENDNIKDKDKKSNGKATYKSWSDYKEDLVPDQLHKDWKNNGEYIEAKGMVILPGKVLEGEHKDQFFVAIDFDQESTFIEFCDISGTKFDEQKEKFIVEQHKKDLIDGQRPDDEDDPSSLHLYFYSEIPFIDKWANDAGIEIYSNSKHVICVTPSYHYESKSFWQIKGTGEPVILNAEQANKMMSDFDKIYQKHNVKYLNQNNNDTNNYNNTGNSNLPDELAKLAYSLEISPNFQFRINEGSRHNTMLSFARKLLYVNGFHTNVSKDDLKTFFLEINNKICVPPLPEKEIQQIWKDALKYSEEKSARIKIQGDDISDTTTYKSQIVIQLDKGNKIIEKEFCQNFVYDIPSNSIDCSLNTIYKHNPRILQPVNIKQWPEVRKDFRKQCEEKKIEEEDILLLLDALDKNYDLIKKHYLEYYRKTNNALAAITERRRKREELVINGTEFLLAKHIFKTDEKTNDILVYNPEKGVFEYGGEVIIGKELEEKFGYDMTTAIVNEIRDHIIRKTGVTKDQFDADLNIINLKDCRYNWREDKRLDHSPDYLSLNQKPIKYNPKAIPRRFIKFLLEVLHLKDIRTVVELIAYTFIRTHWWQQYTILKGEGGNGKNVLLEIISRLHGEYNVSYVALKDIARDRFALVDLVNKDVNIDTESTSVDDISSLKKLTDNTLQRVQQKGQKAFPAKLYAKPFFAANKLPTTADNTYSRFRREIIIEFPRQFEIGKNADPDLLNKIVNNEEEMSGIFNLVVNSLKVISKYNQIHQSAATTKERRAKAKISQNPMKAFLKYALAKEPTDKDYETSEDMYNAFERYLNYHQVSGPGKDDFLEKLREEFHLVKRRKQTPEGKITIWKCKLVRWKNVLDDPSQILDEDIDFDEDVDEIEIEQQPVETSQEKYDREQEEQKKW
jgi:P4 family phage/plasmid primase-like protien